MKHTILAGLLAVFALQGFAQSQPPPPDDPTERLNANMHAIGNKGLTDFNYSYADSLTVDSLRRGLIGGSTGPGVPPAVLTGLQNSVTALTETTEETAQAVSGLQQTVTTVAQSVSNTAQTVTGLQQTVTTVAQSNSANAQNVSNLQQTVTSQAQSLSGLTTKANSISADVGTRVTRTEFDQTLAQPEYNRKLAGRDFAVAGDSVVFKAERFNQLAQPLSNSLSQAQTQIANVAQENVTQAQSISAIQAAGYRTASQVQATAAAAARDTAIARTKTIVFVGPGVTTVGNNTTVNVGSGGTATTIDQVVSNATATAISPKGVKDYVDPVSALVTTLSNSLTALQAIVSSHTTTINTLTANVAANAATISSQGSLLSSQATTIAQLQSDVAALSGVYTIATPTLSASVLSPSSIALSWPASTSANSYTLQQSTNSGFTSPTTLTVTAGTSYTATGLTAETAYWFRVRASGGSGTAASGYGSVSAVTPANLTFTVERTWRMSFTNSTYGVTPPTGWVKVAPTTAQIQTANGFTSAALNTEAGAASTLTVAVVDPFTQTTASSATATTGSLYAQTVNQVGWVVTSTNSTGGSFTLNGLTPGKFYQAYLYGVSNSTGTAQYTVNGTVKTKNILNNYGVGGGNEFDPNTALVPYNNLQADGTGKITVRVNYTTGASSVLNAVVLQESTNPKP